MIFSTLLSLLLVTCVYGKPYDSIFPMKQKPGFVYGKPTEICFPISQAQTDKGKCYCKVAEIMELKKKIQQLPVNLEDTFCTVGLGDRRLRDQDITASSLWDKEHAPFQARLDNQMGRRGNARSRGSWSARPSQLGEWIQVDLLKPTRVTGVITQGRPTEYAQWVTSFKIAYGHSVDNLHVMTDEQGTEIIFEGNNDESSYAINKFSVPVEARYVRLLPQTWHNHMSLRMEFLTC